MTDSTDARGVRITDGALCVYGATVGRSVALVEGVIDGFTASGRVWVRVVRRAYGGWGVDLKDRVHVGPDRLVIVDSLPASNLPTQEEAVRAERRRLIDLYRDRIADRQAGGEPQNPWETREEEELAFCRKRLTELEAACGDCAG